MVEKKPVNVNWQTVFVFFPIIDLWAAYRIERLRVYLLIFALGFGAVNLSLSFGLEGWDPSSILIQDGTMNIGTDPDVAFFSGAMAALLGLGVVELVARIYCIRRWSKEWNLKVGDDFGRAGLY